MPFGVAPIIYWKKRKKERKKLYYLCRPRSLSDSMLIFGLIMSPSDKAGSQCVIFSLESVLSGEL